MGDNLSEGDLSIHHIRFSNNYDLIIKHNIINIGDRIRDMKYSKKDNSLLLVLENQKALGIIFKN